MDAHRGVHDERLESIELVVARAWSEARDRRNRPAQRLARLATSRLRAACAADPGGARQGELLADAAAYAWASQRAVEVASAPPRG